MVQTVTINEAAALKGVSRQAVHAAIKASKLETVTVEIPSTRVTRKSLNAWTPNENMKRAGRPRKAKS
jgi:hypothetical protein